jgi:hypothetical protein
MPDLPVLTGPAARHCEEAQPTKQSSRKPTLDCFAALAMTGRDPAYRNFWIFFHDTLDIPIYWDHNPFRPVPPRGALEAF